MEKADTTILVKMERLGWTLRAFPKREAWCPLRSGPCLERLAKQRKSFRTWGGICFVHRAKPKLPPPCRVGTRFVYHRYSTTMPLFLLLLCVLFVKLRTRGEKKASSTSASGVLCREALRTNYRRRPFLRHEALSLFRQSPGSAEPPPRGPRWKPLLVCEHRAQG